MYPNCALHAPNHPPQQKLVDTLSVCAFFWNGEKLYAFEASWRNLFDFMKAENRGQFEVTGCEEWKSANEEDWGIRFHVPVMFRVVVHANEMLTVMLKTERWQNRYTLQKGRSRLVSHKWVRGQHFIIQQPWCSFKD